MSKYTPGPWRAICNRTKWGIYLVDKLGRIAKIDLTTRENAALVAAAPELYEALRKAEYTLSALAGSGVPATLEAARAALAKVDA